MQRSVENIWEAYTGRHWRWRRLVIYQRQKQMLSKFMGRWSCCENLILKKFDSRDVVLIGLSNIPASSKQLIKFNMKEIFWKFEFKIQKFPFTIFYVAPLK